MYKFIFIIISIFITVSSQAQGNYQSTKVSKKKVLQNYLIAVTQTQNYRKAKKKLLDLKTFQLTANIIPDKGTMKMKKTMEFKFPNKRHMRVEFNGLLLQESFFNGKQGYTKKMNAQQKIDLDSLTKAEVNDQRKISALYPEFSLLCNLKDVHLLGIESKKDHPAEYVIQYTVDSIKTIARYNVKTGLKDYADVIDKSGEEKKQYTTIYSQYEAYSGYLFPTQTRQLIESMSVKTAILSIKINIPITPPIFAPQ